MSKVLAIGLTVGVGLSLAMSSCAKAEDFTIRHSHTHYNVWNWNEHPMVQQVPQPTSAAGLAAQAEEDARWEKFCRPIRRVDDLGVTRLSYAHDGCEFGRSQ